MRWRPTPPRLSVLQAMKLVLFAAAASACVGSIYRVHLLGAGTFASVLGSSAVCVPLVWAVLCFVLVRRGPSRDRAIRPLPATSAASAPAIDIRMVAPIARSVTRWGPRGVLPSTIVWMVLMIASAALFATALVMLPWPPRGRGAHARRRGDLAPSTPEAGPD